MSESNKRCDRCHKPMTSTWFHKKDDNEEVDICLDCYEDEYGPWVDTRNYGDE